MAKLVTAHDILHVHKALGIACLLHFLYRYAWLWPTTGRLGMQVSSWRLIIMHLLLSVSSLVFKVPAARVRSQPTTIWKEYQLHAILFTARCVVAFLLWPSTPALLRYALIIPFHAAADMVTEQYGTPGSTTVRGKHALKKGWLVSRMIVAYGLYQHLALASHLLPNVRGRDLGFNAIIAIQSSAFAMTLVRKGWITWRMHAASYTACIAISALYIVRSLTPLESLSAVLAYGARRAGCNKYVLWGVFTLLHT